jgi:hypothetical protein
MNTFPINPDEEYTPTQITRYGWILNNRNRPNYKYILQLIKAGKLRARNVCTSNTGAKYYKVLGADILKYKQSSYNIPQQP